MVLFVAGWVALARAGVAVEDAEGGRQLVRGVEAVVVVTDDAGDAVSGETVRVVHRPGLAGERELAIGISDGRGRVRWTPEIAGVARIRAGQEIEHVRVVPSERPASTIVLIAVSVAAGLGALVYGVWGSRGSAPAGEAA